MNELSRDDVMDAMVTLTPGGDESSWSTKGPSRGKTPLHLAAFTKSGTDNYDLEKQCYDLLCALAKQAELLDYKDEQGNAPLHTACASGNTQMVDSLLSAGAGVTPPPFIAAFPEHVVYLFRTLL